MIHAGQVLNGRYKLLRPLGQGSQAFVWVAEHLALGSQVAVKLIDPELAKQDDARERFAREATAAAKLRSAHVVQMLDHGIENDQPFIVMELLEGEDLFDRLERRRLTLAETSKIVTQVARALMRAHAEGIIHRDLKPENVFLVKNEDDELAKVLDFGVAKITLPQKAVMTRTGVGTLIGTPHYMSPEQVKGVSEIDHRSDLWSLGVIAYQCVTGRLPFDSEGVGDLLIRIAQNTPVAPSTLNDELPPAFDEWFKKACAKNPAARFQSAREMAEALAKAVGIQQVMSQPGNVLVNLMDSVDLDWGSLAGVRIPAPTGAIPAASPSNRSREETLDGNDMIEVVEASRPPPAPSEPPVAVRVAPPPAPRAPKLPDDIGALAQSPDLAANPFLAAPPPSRPVPSSGRSLQSTVTGLASTSDPPGAIDAPPELDGSRKRKAVWFVSVALVIGAVAVTVGVMQSRARFGDGQAAQPAPTSTGARPTASSTEVVQSPEAVSAPAPSGTPSSAASSASASASAVAVDPEVTKKPPPAPAQPSAAPRTKRSSGGGAIEIEIPDPDREVRLPPGQ